MRIRLAVLVTVAAASLIAQPSRRPPSRAQAAEMAVKQAAEQVAAEKKEVERAVDVLRRLRNADRALADAMQPATAIQTAFEEVEAARALGPDFLVLQGIARTSRKLQDARRSPASADFGHLRSILRDEAVGPASRVAVQHALLLQDEALAWMKVQELVAVHLRTISEITGESLRASQEEKEWRGR